MVLDLGHGALGRPVHRVRGRHPRQVGDVLRVKVGAAAALEARVLGLELLAGDVAELVHAHRPRVLARGVLLVVGADAAEVGDKHPPAVRLLERVLVRAAVGGLEGVKGRALVVGDVAAGEGLLRRRRGRLAAAGRRREQARRAEQGGGGGGDAGARDAGRGGGRGHASKVRRSLGLHLAVVVALRGNARPRTLR